MCALKGRSRTPSPPPCSDTEVHILVLSNVCEGGFRGAIEEELQRRFICDHRSTLRFQSPTLGSDTSEEAISPPVSSGQRKKRLSHFVHLNHTPTRCRIRRTHISQLLLNIAIPTSDVAEVKTVRTATHFVFRRQRTIRTSHSTAHRQRKKVWRHRLCRVISGELPGDKMATRLKTSDQPQPWFSKNKKKASTAGQSKAVSASTVVENMKTGKESHNRGNMNRRLGEAEVKVIQRKKGTKKGKAVTASALDNVLSIANSAVPDVDELRRKREEDARACGRTVRIVSSPSTRRSDAASFRTNYTEVERNHVAGKSLPSGVGPSSPEAVGNLLSTESADEVEGHTPGYTKDSADGQTGSLSQRPGKEVMQCDSQNEVDHPNNIDPAIPRRARQVEFKSDTESGGKNRNAMLSNQGRSGSPMGKYSTDRYRRREIQRRDSPSPRRSSERTEFRDSIWRSTESSGKTQKRMTDSRSPPRIVLRSPVHGRGSGHRRSENDFREHYEGNPVTYRRYNEEDYRISTRYSSMEREGTGRYKSSSPENALRYRRSASPECGQLSRRSRTPMSSSSPPTRSRSREGAQAMELSGCAAAKNINFVGTPTPLDRTQRRHRQKCRESDKRKREKDGKKPLYLTLNDEGKPYGLGKPAWIALINKLASGLDPSCTHIRKQTFEAVQTFLDRLNEQFEYSGRLNEDYVRGLMGKAVTKRRAQLISLIRRGGEQQKHVDAEVWRRLEKLAFSRQHQEKSEVARYANACRKTFGRTGSIGENGIRENLRMLLHRSPDPDEVQEEMQRHKGFGGRKRKVQGLSVEEENAAIVVMSDDDMRSPMHGESSKQLAIRTMYSDMEEKKSNGGESEDGLEEVDVGTEETLNAEKSYATQKTETLSKDEYILKLEARIKRLEAYESNASTSDARMSRFPSKSLL